MRLLLIALLCAGCGQGPQGNVGLPGPVGPPGPVGSNGTVITVVQFCVGTPTYPSTFPETGICVNNTVYAVYSIPDAFLTEIPPGTYTSNGINSSCTFTVLPNCVIQN